MSIYFVSLKIFHKPLNQKETICLNTIFSINQILIPVPKQRRHWVKISLQISFTKILKDFYKNRSFKFIILIKATIVDKIYETHCVKSVRIRSYSGQMRARITPSTDTFYAVTISRNQANLKRTGKLWHLFCVIFVLKFWSFIFGRETGY